MSEQTTESTAPEADDFDQQFESQLSTHASGEADHSADLEWLAKAGSRAQKAIDARKGNQARQAVHDHLAAKLTATGRPVPKGGQADDKAKAKATADAVRAKYAASGRKPL